MHIIVLQRLTESNNVIFVNDSWIKDITSYMNPAIILGIMLGFQNDRIYKEVPSLEEFLDL